MQRLLSACVAVAVLSLAGCNNSKVYGRIIGFLVDGTTGATLNVFPASGINNVGNDGNATNDVYALIQGSIKRAQPCGEGDANKTNGIPADGCYRFEGVPTDTAIQIFAQYAGYEKFQGQTTVAREAATTTDIVDADPQVIANIQLFPVGFKLDYHVLVTGTARQPLAGAVINCQHNDLSDLSLSGSNFVQPEYTTTGAVSATTDASGAATIPGASLINGAHYSCNVTPTGTSYVAQNDSFSFNAGEGDTSINVNLNTNVNNTLYALYSNVDSSEALFGNATSLIITLNVPAEFVPGTDDCQKAFVNAPDTNQNANTAPTLPADVLNNGVSESMTASLSSDGLTLTLNVKGLTGSFDPGDSGTYVYYEGVFLRVKGNASVAQSDFYIGSDSPNASKSCAIGYELDDNQLYNQHINSNQRDYVELY